MAKFEFVPKKYLRNINLNQFSKKAGDFFKPRGCEGLISKSREIEYAEWPLPKL